MSTSIFIWYVLSPYTILEQDTFMCDCVGVGTSSTASEQVPARDQMYVYTS